MANEILDQVMTDDGNLVIQDSLSTDGGGCEGNIVTPCIREGLEEIADTLSEADFEWGLAGGIGSQVNALVYTGDIRKAIDEYKKRNTDDLDIIVSDKSRAERTLRESSYGSSVVPRADIINNETFRRGLEEVLESSYPENLAEYDEELEAELNIFPDAELLYTKTHDMKPEEERFGLGKGTYFDVERLVTGNTSNIDITRYKELMNNYSDTSGSRAVELLEL